jgi:hypothetical protein
VLHTSICVMSVHIVIKSWHLTSDLLKARAGPCFSRRLDFESLMEIVKSLFKGHPDLKQGMIRFYKVNPMALHYDCLAKCGKPFY